MHDSHKKYVAVILMLGVLSLPSFINAAGIGGFFGGQIIIEQVCNTGLLLTIRQFSSTKQLMWLTGDLPYLMHVVPHIGQYILGKAGTSATCVLGTVTQGQGDLILYHGSSI